METQKTGSLYLADRKFDVVGNIYPYIDADDIEWFVDIMSAGSSDFRPFDVYLTANPLSELGGSRFDVMQNSFSYSFHGSNSFYFAAGGGLIDVGSLDVRLNRNEGTPFKEMHFWAKGKIDALASVKYDRALECEVSVDLSFEVIKCAHSVSMELDAKRIREQTGIDASFKVWRHLANGTTEYKIDQIMV